MYNENAKGKDSVTLDESLGQVTEHNIQFQFTQTGADVPTHRFTGLPITLKAGENKTFTISTDATSKYEPFSKTVTVKVTKTEAPKKQTLHIKTLTIHGKSAASGMVTIPTDKNQVIKDNITLEFLEEGDGVPESRSFSMSPESVSLANAGDKATLTLSTQETEKYNKWELAIEVTREKTGGQEKTIDDCVATLTSQLTWAGIAVDKPISLPATVTGYDNSTVAWTCTDEHVDAATGKIKQDLANITVELQAKVMWKGQEKTVTFNVTVQRLKRIKWITERGQTKIEHVADLSKDGVLLYSEDNKPSLEFEIKNVDVKEKKFLAKLTRKGVANVLKTIDEILASEIKGKNELFEKKEFGDKYVELENKTGITWDDLKAYILLQGCHSQESSDEEIFGFFRSFSGYKNSLSDFKALPDGERDKIVKDYLKKIKNEYAMEYVISKELSTPEFLKQLKVKFAAMHEINLKHLAKEFTWKYTLEEKDDKTKFMDGYAFDARGLYDSQRQYYDQPGAYTDYPDHNRIVFAKEYNNKLNITLNFDLGGGKGLVVGDYAIPPSSSLELHGLDIKYPEKLNCTISATQDGKLTCNITTDGEYEGAYDVTFTGFRIFCLDCPL